MRILVFDPLTPLSAKPDHNCSRSRAKLAVGMKYARQIGQNTIQLINLTWREVKQRLAGIVPEPVKPWAYEHHIEPHIERLTIADSPWLRYMQFGHAVMV